MHHDLAERIRTVLNSGPFGLEVTHTGIRGHEPVYRVVCYEHGIPCTEWVFETEDGTAVLSEVLQDLGHGKITDAVFQSEIYRALLLELESVHTESAAVNYGNAVPVTNETLMSIIRDSQKDGK